VDWTDYCAQIPAGDPLVGSAKVPVGLDLDGRLHCADLSDPAHTHILVAGTTGSGKSEWLRTALAGLITSNTPETLRLVLIDPKRVAFGDLHRSPFLLDEGALVFPDERDVTEILGVLIEEMEGRYRLMQTEGVGDIEELARHQGSALPRIVCVCDEYADLVGHGEKKRRQAIEQCIVRLGAKARASGIHLILATQHPSRQIITGALNANMPCRVGLRMQNAIESRMLLNTAGAERLLGQGDLLFRDIGDPQRLQALYLSASNRGQIFQSGGSGSPRLRS
jgi:DNA segregation ATPase FtsK/SpoIIIE-like protein